MLGRKVVVASSKHLKNTIPSNARHVTLDKGRLYYWRKSKNDTNKDKKIG